MNNGKYYTDSYRYKQSVKNDRLWGPIEEHMKVCEECGKSYIWVGRRKTKAFKRARFCSRSCANCCGPKHRTYKTKETYVTICFEHHKKECVVCGEDLIVAVHHYDGNHKNNSPSNLVPLCPTHHIYAHSRYWYVIKECVDDYIKQFVGGVD